MVWLAACNGTSAGSGSGGSGSGGSGSGGSGSGGSGSGGSGSGGGGNGGGGTGGTTSSCAHRRSGCSALLDTQLPDAPVAASDGAATVAGGARRSSIDHVTFAYRDGEPALRDLTLEVARRADAGGGGRHRVGQIDAGEVGRSPLRSGARGASSSTGATCASCSATTLRRRVTTVAQDVFLFTGTVAENVGLGDAAIDRAAIEAACARVGLTERLAGAWRDRRRR